LRAVVLAAGRGERLSPYTDKVPKPLISLHGKTILEHVISTLQGVGITEFVIIIGYLGDIIKKRLSTKRDSDIKIKFVRNPDYKLGNAYSLLCAEKYLKRDECFLLTMSDHIHERSIIEKILNDFQGEPLLCVDKNPKYISDIQEATKVSICEKGYVKDIGKNIRNWDAVDTGLFLLDNRIFRAIKAVSEKPLTLSRCVKKMIGEASLKACEATGRLWLDVDTWEDLAHARTVVERWM